MIFNIWYSPDITLVPCVLLLSPRRQGAKNHKNCCWFLYDPVRSRMFVARETGSFSKSGKPIKKRRGFLADHYFLAKTPRRQENQKSKSKNQNSNKLQFSISKSKTISANLISPPGGITLDIGVLYFGIYLWFGIWDLIFNF